MAYIDTTAYIDTQYSSPLSAFIRYDIVKQLAQLAVLILRETFLQLFVHLLGYVKVASVFCFAAGTKLKLDCVVCV